MNSDYNRLIQKLNIFIRRYYYNLLIKGFLLFIIGFIGITIIIAFSEYLGYFNSLVRTAIYFSFLFYSIVLFIRYIGIPLARLNRIGKSLSLDQAAIILGKFFKNEINDKITNTLQLQKYLEINKENPELLIAGIEQRSRKLVDFPFSNAIDFRQNRKYFYPALGFIVLFVSGWYVAPDAFKGPVTRILNYSIEYQRPAPFDLYFINNMPLTGFKNENYRLNIGFEGNVLPTEVKIRYRNVYALMNNNVKNIFSYEIRNLDSTIEFHIDANGYIFGPYTIRALSKATIKNVVLKVEFPEHTGYRNEVFTNINDIDIPEGSLLDWNIYTEDSYLLSIRVDKTDSLINPGNKQTIEYKHVLEKSADFQFLTADDENYYGDSLNFRVNAIRDQFPTINVHEFVDSVMMSRVFYQGVISDDYGFSELKAYYKIMGNEDSNNYENDNVDISGNILNQTFYYSLDLYERGMKPGNHLELFFEVTDNDLINGFKSTRTQSFYYSIPDYNELISERINTDEKIQESLNTTGSELSRIQEDIDQLRREMVNSDNVSWEQREDLKKLLERQENTIERFEQMQRLAEEVNLKDQQFRNTDQDLLKKHEKLQELMDEVLTDEMKDLYKKIQEELEKLSRDEVFKMLDQMKFELSDFENRLDRAIELYKRLQVERLLQESIEANERILNEQEELNESMNKDGINEELIERQDEINQDFDFVEDLLNQFREKNSELKRPNQIDDTSPLESEVKKQLENSSDNLRENKKQDADGSQQKSMEGMQQLSEAMKEMQNQMRQTNVAEDIRSLRIILDNLLKTSFSQEELMKEFNLVNLRDPRYVRLIQEQNNIKEDLIMIQDSLKALAQRQVQIKSYVDREIEQIKFNIDESVDHLINRRKHIGVTRQQYVMTHVNNLALLLNESMQNMQAMMDAMAGQDMQDGEGQSGGMQDLREMQEKMNQLLEKLQQGQNPMPGESGEPLMGMSEQLARMAAEQENIRRRLNEMIQERKGSGDNGNELEEIMREMERTEMDIITNNVTRRTNLRQQQILTRLLEHERAELERELDEQRIGNTAINYDLSNPVDIFEYNKIKNRELEMIRTLPPAFRPHYKSIVESYFLNVD